MKIVENYPARNLPKELRGDDISPDAKVRVIVQPVGEPDVDGLMRAVGRAEEEARRNGLTEEILKEIVDEAREDYQRRVAGRT